MCRAAMLPGPVGVDRSCISILSYLAVLLVLPTTRSFGDCHSQFTGRESLPSQYRYAFMVLSWILYFPAGSIHPRAGSITMIFFSSLYTPGSHI